jgi:hypothetical protein
MSRHAAERSAVPAFIFGNAEELSANLAACARLDFSATVLERPSLLRVFPRSPVMKPALERAFAHRTTELVTELEDVDTRGVHNQVAATLTPVLDVHGRALAVVVQLLDSRHIVVNRSAPETELQQANGDSAHGRAARAASGRAGDAERGAGQEAAGQGVAAQPRERRARASLDYKETLHQIARLAVPDLADCCFVDLLAGETIERAAIVHQGPRVRAQTAP